MSISLNHLAIIPDGNRRWAKKNAIAGQKKIYEQGSEKTFEILEAALRLGIPYVTFWASSYANLAQRPQGFVEAMEDMYAQKFHELAVHPLIHDNQVHIEIRGEWRDLLKPETVAAMQEAIDATSNYSSQTLTVLVGYDGTHERGEAVLRLLRDAVSGSAVLPQDGPAATKLLHSYSWTDHLPEVDLLIRTGAWEDPHNSAAFLSFLTSETQYAYPRTLWPEFSTDELGQTIDNFLQRERRRGK